MEFTKSLKKNYEFRRVYARGKSASTARIFLYCRKNGKRGNRFGLTVSNKIGKAVQRNRIRRRLREIYRLNEGKMDRGYDIILVARHRSRDAEFQQLWADFLMLSKKMGILKEKNEESINRSCSIL